MEFLQALAAGAARVLPAPGRVLLAVSGGGDSLAMLHGWAELTRGDWLSAAHFDHRARPDSAADAAFVVQAAAAVGIPCVVGMAPAPMAGAAEAELRDARYAFLLQAARELDCAAVAVAHTAEDQAETVLLRLLRGAGLPGLAGMAAARPLAERRLVRPLLQVRRETLRGYLAARGLVPREDPSNADAARRRNRVRQELLPLLRASYQPRIDDVLLRLAEQAAAAAAELDRAAASLEAQAGQAAPTGESRWDAAALHAAPPLVAGQALRQAWLRHGWPRRRLDAATLARALAVAGPNGPTAVDLPDGVRAARRKGMLRLSRRQTPTSGESTAEGPPPT